MDLNLSGKKAIVTGASQGIGKATALEMIKEGAEVLAIGRNTNLLTQLQLEADSISQNKLISYQLDLMTDNAAANIADHALSTLGVVDILINNAGRSQPVEIAGDGDRWKQSMTLEFDRPRELTEALLPHFIKRKAGSILNVISTFELQTLNASAVSKSALVAWAKQLSWRIGHHGIRINCLQPGLIDTENIRRFFPGDQRKAFAEKEIALRDFGDSDDIAAMAAFLVSPRARYITGSIATVDGGMKRAPF